MLLIHRQARGGPPYVDVFRITGAVAAGIGDSVREGFVAFFSSTGGMDASACCDTALAVPALFSVVVGHPCLDQRQFSTGEVVVYVVH